jgi:hypothetical protein
LNSKILTSVPERTNTDTVPKAVSIWKSTIACPR